MKIGDLSKRTNLSTSTIRYYERIGLLPHALRDASGRRDYDASILSWIVFLDRLKATGMPIREMLNYAALQRRGLGTETERCVLLEHHRERVRAHIANLQSCLLVLDTKIDGYASQTQRTLDNDACSTAHGRKPPRARQARTG